MQYIKLHSEEYCRSVQQSVFRLFEQAWYFMQILPDISS